MTSGVRFAAAQPAEGRCLVCNTPGRRTILARSEIFANLTFPICNLCLDMNAEPITIINAALVKSVKVPREIMTFTGGEYVNVNRLVENSR